MNLREGTWRTGNAIRHALRLRPARPLPFHVRSRTAWQRLRLVLVGSAVYWVVVGGFMAFILAMLATSENQAERVLFPHVAVFCAAISAVALALNVWILRRTYSRYEDPGISLTLNEQGLLFAQRGRGAARYSWHQLSAQEILSMVMRGGCFFAGVVLRAPGFVLTIDNLTFPRGMMAGAIAVQQLVAHGRLARPAEE